MSEENVQVVEAALKAFARGGLDAFAEFWTDDIDHRAIEGSVDDRGPLKGKDSVRAYVQDWLDTFDDLSVEPVELLDAGEGRVIAVLRLSGRAKLSGVETDLTYAAEAGRSHGAASTRHETRPSKPPGFRSRRCRRRTSVGQVLSRSTARLSHRRKRSSRSPVGEARSSAPRSFQRRRQRRVVQHRHRRGPLPPARPGDRRQAVKDHRLGSELCQLAVTLG